MVNHVLYSLPVCARKLRSHRKIKWATGKKKGFYYHGIINFKMIWWRSLYTDDINLKSSNQGSRR
jgi:hypothetical protein